VSLLLFPPSVSASDVVDLAASLIGRPYVWGAEGPNSFDCSGLTQYVFQEFGIELPRRAISQSRVGDRTGDRLQRGDLLFFSSDARQSLVTHVGIYEGGGRMIEASKRYGRVRRDRLDDEYWVERFMFARRVADTGRGDEPIERSGRTRINKRETAIRVLETLAGVLIRRPSR
jgi:cell wall-associated NlpC family hydrolase